MIAEDFLLSPNDWVPNHATFPVIVYRQVLSPGEPGKTAAEFEALFADNEWPAQWRNGVYDYHHYHSTAHEVLGVAAGEGLLAIGGPEGREIKLEAGDALLLPAGVGHCRLESSPDFLVVGAYPEGQTFDIRREAASVETLEAIAALGRPRRDPVSGAGGPLTRLWRVGA